MFHDPTFAAALENYQEERKATGKRFEEMMTKTIKRFAASENLQRQKAGIKERMNVEPYSDEEDEHYGTDIMLYDASGFFGHDGIIRFDITHNFSKKNNMPFVNNTEKAEPLIIEGLDGHDYEFHYGIRTGNPHKNFEEPVIVIGFDMSAKEFCRFEKDMLAYENLAKNIYEIVNMSNDVLQSFYYMVDPKTQEQIDANMEEDERPDVELITFNKNYLMEIGRYASRRWKLPSDTKLNEQARDLLQDMVYSPVLERLHQKYEEQNLAEGIEAVDQQKASEMKK